MVRTGLAFLLLACMFVGTAHAQSVPPAWSAEGDQPGARLGSSVAPAGDVNGDGYDDVLLGAPGHDGEQADGGRAHLFLGSAAGLSPTPVWTVVGDQSGAHLGAAVASAGDVNGDGFDDVLVAAPDYDDGQVDEGLVFLYLGSPDGPAPTPAVVWQQDHAGARFGSAVGCAGDVNADGFDDVLVGAPGMEQGETDEGAAYLFLGTAAQPARVPAWSAQGNQTGASFGSSVATLGDIDGDGFDDVVIGAPLFDGGQVNEGQARVFAGTATSLGSSPLQSFEINAAGAQFGSAVAGGGDLNGNGTREMLFGAPVYEYTHVDEGGTWMAGLGQGTFFLDFGRQAFAHRGVSIASAGDVNADGLMDVVIGADRYDQGEEDEGRVTVHLGHSGFVVDRTPAWTMDGDQAFCAFGSSVASAGDVNGDGYDDVVIGAPQYDRGQTDEGRAFVYLGPSGVTVGVPREFEAAGQLALHPVGPNPSSSGMRWTYVIPHSGGVQLAVFDARGRRRALLVNEVQEAGRHEANWDGLDQSGVDCPAGLYFVRLTFGSSSVVHRTVLVR